MENLMDFSCDKGSLVVNGICFRSGGDGQHTLYYCDGINKLHKNFKIIDNVWVDLRDTDLVVQVYDCDTNNTVKYTKEDLGCLAIQIAKDKFGNYCFVRYF